MRVRGVLEPLDTGLGIVLGHAWRLRRGIGPDDEVTVVLEAEGHHAGDLAPQSAAVLDAEPAVTQFFDSLAQSCRNAYPKWVDATKRRPGLRVLRIAEMVD
ncbi:MAG: YdeI/OmpD-associated family protein [Egibacteraceae bacterium]